MKRRLSSKQTFLLKIVLPIFFVVMITTAFTGIIVSSRGNELLILMIVFPLLGFIGILSMYLTVMRYKKVSIDDKFLYVSNYRKEITIPVSNIADVTEVKWIRTRPITIHLKNASEFGEKIVFMPKFNGFRIFADNPVVTELKQQRDKIMTNDQLKKSNENLKSYVFKFECSQIWESLTETDDERIRHCGQCNTKVFAVENDAELLANAEKGHCIYLPPMRTAGIPYMPDKSE